MSHSFTSPLQTHIYRAYMSIWVNYTVFFNGIPQVIPLDESKMNMLPFMMLFKHQILIWPLRGSWWCDLGLQSPPLQLLLMSLWSQPDRTREHAPSNGETARPQDGLGTMLSAKGGETLTRKLNLFFIEAGDETNSTTCCCNGFRCSSFCRIHADLHQPPLCPSLQTPQCNLA